MPYSGMTPKQKRIIDRDLERLFSPGAFLLKPTLEDIKRLDLFHPTVEINRGTLFLSDKGEAALKRITNLVYSTSALSDSVSRREISIAVLKSYNDWLEKLLEPTSQEFVDGIAKKLMATVNEFEFLIKIEGLDLKDQDCIELGSVRVQRSNRALLENVKFEGALTFESMYNEFKDSLWLVGRVKGSSDVASEQSEYRATLTVGILAVCGALLYKGAVWRSRVRAVISPFENRSATSSLMWEVGGDNPSYSRKWGGEQDLLLSSESIAHLNQACFLQQLASLADRQNRSELQNAIIRSIYWFADAYRDRNPTMQFVKLWSCAECFFAIDKEGVTALNAKGFAAVLTFAGFRIIDVKEYPEFKRRIKVLYGLRSQAIHRGSFGHIEISDLDDLSKWIAWIIVSMVSLSERGYGTLRQVQEQTSRLDQLSVTTNSGTTGCIKEE